jgi:hypothetical protein
MFHKKEIVWDKFQLQKLRDDASQIQKLWPQHNILVDFFFFEHKSHLLRNNMKIWIMIEMIDNIIKL